MSTISASTTSTTAYKVTADTTGTLVLQTGSTPTTAVTIDTAQNLGLGVTPSAWTLAPAFELKQSGVGIWNSGSNDLYLSNNAYYNSGWKYGTTSVTASQYRQVSGTHSWFTAPSGTAGNPITFTQAMTLDASGNLGVGVTNPSSYSSKFVVNASAGGTSAIFTDSTNYTFGIKSGGSGVSLIGGEAGNALAFQAGATERARIDTSGNLLVGTTSVGTMAGNVVERLANTGIIARTSSSVVNGGTLNIVVSSGGASFAGFLVVENVVLSNALIRTQTTYSVFGRGTTFTATSIASVNGGSGAASFTITCPSTGVISFTNTSGNTTGVNMSFFGSEGF